jgi:hypothetical protein
MVRHGLLGLRFADGLTGEMDVWPDQDVPA